MDIKKAFQTYYVSALKRYFDFNGRTSKKAYWMFVLFNVLISWVAIAVDNILGTEEVGRISLWGIRNGMFNNFYGLVMLLPGIAIAVRRLHDIGKNGRTMFLLFIPVVGWILVLMDLIKEGDPRENEFGPVPKDGDIPQPEGHPYKPNEGSVKENDIDVPAIKQEVEKVVAKQKLQPKPKKKKSTNTKKKFSIRDRGAVDFTYHSKEKRKT